MTGRSSAQSFWSVCVAMPGELASDWESDALLRNRGRANGILTSWPSKKTTGIPSMKACVQNVRVLELATLWWARIKDEPEAIKIDDVRAEARFQKCLNHPRTKFTLYLHLFFLYF